MIEVTPLSNTSYQNELLTWDIVPGATGYLVEINGVEEYTTDSSHSLSTLS